jgi:hypothetical protein
MSDAIQKTKTKVQQILRWTHRQMDSYTNKCTDKHTEINIYIIPRWIDGRIKKERRTEAQTRSTQPRKLK